MINRVFFNFRILFTGMNEGVSNLKLLRIQRKVKIHGTCDKAIHTPNIMARSFVDLGLSSPKNGNYTKGLFLSFLQNK